jgi:hypothetical protein
MRVCVTEADIQENPQCPVEPALRRLTGQDWLVGVGCAERQVEVEEDGDTVLKTAIIDMPEVAYNYIADAADGKPAAPIEFDVAEPRILG